MFFQTLTLLNFTPLIDIYLAISQHSAIFPYHPIPLFRPYSNIQMRTLKSTIKFLYKVEWKCVQVIKNFIFQSLTIQKNVSNLSHQYWWYYFYNSENYRKFFALFYKIPIRNSIYPIHNLFVKKNQTVANYNFQSIIVNLTQSKQK